MGRAIVDKSKTKSPGNPTVSFRLVEEYERKLRVAAEASRVTPNALARQLLVAALENPSKEELLSDLGELLHEVSCLASHVEELRVEVSELKASVAAGFELLLVYLGGVKPDEAIESVDPLFFREEKEEG